MKSALVLLTLTSSVSSFAALTGSTYELRHQDIIEKAILKECGNMRNLTVLSTIEKVIRVDQGIHDVKYETVLSGEQRMDQNIFDTYKITVNSDYADMYDHSAKEWGAYSVSAVNCVME